MQLSSYENITQDNIIFNESKEFKVKDSKIKYKRNSQLKSNIQMERKEKGKSEPNTKEKAFFDVINNVTTLSQQHLENEYGADLASTLSSPFYFKQEEYTDKKGKKKTRIDPSAAPVLYAKLIYSEKSKKILSLFKTKGKKDLNPFKYIDQYCNVKMALIIEGIFITKTVTSLQIKVHECYDKPLKPRESLLTIEEEEQSDSETVEQSEVDNIEDLVISDKEENE